MTCLHRRTRENQGKDGESDTHSEVSHDAADDRAVTDEEDVGRFALEFEDDGLEPVRKGRERKCSAVLSASCLESF